MRGSPEKFFVPGPWLLLLDHNTPKGEDMPNCRYCGKWAGLFGDEHVDCAAAAAKEGKAQIQTVALPVVSLRRIVMGVFFGIWLYTISSAVLAVLVWALFFRR